MSKYARSMTSQFPQEKKFVQEVMALAGIDINGSNPWDITVYDNQFYGSILTNTELAFGETYVEKLWDCPKLDQLFYKILTAELEKKALNYPKFWRSVLNQCIYKFARIVFNYQTKSKSFVVGKKHYDIGNDLYSKMLDKRMVYTCAYWENAQNLDDAQEKKLKLACQKLNLEPGLTVLDIGCGWGSFAQYAAQNYGVSIVGITISKEQVDLAKKLCSGLPIEIRLQDYRDLLKAPTKYDRIVSLGMLEHVGYKNYPIYMQTISHCLKDDGLFLLQTIGANNSSNSSNIWLDRYIFPNSQIPTIAQIALSFENILVMEDWQNFGIYYDKTLMAWYENFNQHWDELKQNYDERFRRMWNYYLLSCAGSFRARRNQLWQILLSKKGLPQGYSRSKNKL